MNWRVHANNENRFKRWHRDLPHMHRGTLKVGSDAPDARIVALDGSSRFHIRERTGGGRPLVLVFGSFT
jgi:hypothetical protein